MKRLPKNFIVRQSGQALLLILFVLALVLTVSLSSVSRSVTDVDISKYEDNSIRAFDAAQVGIEKSVVGQAVTEGSYTLDNNSSFTVNISTQSASADANNFNYMKYPIALSSGESAIFYFVRHKEEIYGSDSDLKMYCGTAGYNCTAPAHINFCWGNPGTPSDSDRTPAILLEFYKNNDSANPKKWIDMSDLKDISVKIVTADPNDSRRVDNKFSTLNSGGDSCPEGTWEFESLYQASDMGYDVSERDQLLFVKVTMLYNDTPQIIGLTSASPLPPQKKMISSTGSSGDVTRRLVLYQGFPEIPTEFLNAIYSKSDLSK